MNVCMAFPSKLSSVHPQLSMSSWSDVDDLSLRSSDRQILP